MARHAIERLIDVLVGDVDDVALGDLQFELFVDELVECLLAGLLLVRGDFGEPHPLRDVEHRDRIAVDQGGDLGVGARVPQRCDRQRQHQGAGEARSKPSDCMESWNLHRVIPANGFLVDPRPRQLGAVPPTRVENPVPPRVRRLICTMTIWSVPTAVEVAFVGEKP